MPERIADKATAEAALVGRRIVSAEVVDAEREDSGYVVLQLDDGSRLYADAPNVYLPEMSRDDIIAAVKGACADLIVDGVSTWTPDDSERIAALLNRDRDPWELFRLLDEKTGDWRIGYRTDDGREWLPVLRQMRNAQDSRLLDGLRR